MTNPIDKAKRKASRSLIALLHEVRDPTYFVGERRQDELEMQCAIEYHNALLSLLRIHKEERGG